MQISASASPAAYPPGVSMPASITRAPPGSVRSETRSASAFVAMRSAISNARPFRSSPPPPPPPPARSPPPRAPPRRPPHPRTRPGRRAPRAPRGRARPPAPAPRRPPPRPRPPPPRHEDLAGRHPGADPFHAGELALDPDRGRALAIHLEEVAQLRGAAAVHHGQRGDLRGAERREPVGRDRSGDQRVLRFLPKGEDDRVAHAMIFRRWK